MLTIEQLPISKRAHLSDDTPDTVTLFDPDPQQIDSEAESLIAYLLQDISSKEFFKSKANSIFRKHYRIFLPSYRFGDPG